MDYQPKPLDNNRIALPEELNLLKEELPYASFFQKDIS